MIEKNLEYLKDNIKYQGFGESMNVELENHLKKGLPEFSLSYKTEVGKQNLEAKLHFRKSDSTEMYFFNKYDVRVETERKERSVSQTFYLNNGKGVTLKEAYNLLNGRAVYKELTDKEDQKYHAWIQLDFGVKDKNGNYERKQFHQNYGFDLKDVLAKYPIKEMESKMEQEKLLKSLEKGNIQAVTLNNGASEMKVFIEANPKFKTISIYDTKMQNLEQEKRQELRQAMADRQEPKAPKVELKEEVSEKKTLKGNRAVKEGQGELPKKQSRKKGISI